MGIENGPDLRSLIQNSMPQKEGPARMCGGLFSESINVGSQMSLQAAPCIVKFEGKFQAAAPKRPMLCDKILKALNISPQIVADIGKCAKDAGAMYAGNVTNGPPTSSGVAGISTGSGMDLS